MNELLSHCSRNEIWSQSHWWNQIDNISQMKKMQLNLNKKLIHYINNLRKLILRTIYFEIFVRINKTVANKMIHSIFKKKKFLNWTTNDLKKVFEKKLFELSINQIFEKHKIFIANNEIVISIIQNRILSEIIIFTSNLILSRTSNKRSVLQNTMNISFFFHFRHYIFFIASIHRRILSKSIVMKNFTQSSIQFFFVDVTEKIENELFEIFINFVYFENASIKKRCTCVASIFKFWKKTIENSEIFFLSIARRLLLSDTKRLKFITFITKMRLKNWT